MKPYHRANLYVLLVCLIVACSSVAAPSIETPVATPVEEAPAAGPAKAETPADEASVVTEEPAIAAEPQIEEEAEQPPAVELAVPVEEVPFDPSTITREVFDSTKTDVQQLISRLNEIIRTKDFQTWTEFLGAEYRRAMSDKAFLSRMSDFSVLKKQNIVLTELRDYFIYVVVPSRAKDRVDDIEFIGQNRVKAFTINAKGQRLRLYDLEKTEGGWKIVG
ncbi:MAG: hypothetical protein A2Z99_11815 [Treponema sp. GWB1_62_6]|nr:MAG: hypothetical protein A2Z99_11815 [Treponema sp. GWB1_62_6]OHE69223.1 MAG: hypothetical protein A2001_13565 [Treponema sp. GWC1_61_84]OHE71079.1 MAG: hypothetical protein A2413_17115 [Treponema sp. RIFOXYC1_FULL_61_9]HCM27151.1 hypothetical protein [Treponema sp.]